MCFALCNGRGRGAERGLIVDCSRACVRACVRACCRAITQAIIFDDSFEHEVFQNANTARLILIVDLPHPDMDEFRREELLSMNDGLI